MGKSIWTEDTHLPAFPPLEGNVQADVLVIGGGITGILCAHALHEIGLDVVLAEAGRLCGGVTGGTTAKITIQHGLFAVQLLHRLGTERAQGYLRLQQAALDRYRALSRGIDCAFEEMDSFVYSSDGRSALEQEVRALEQLGVPTSLMESTCLPFPTAGAVKIPGQAQFHPLRFLAALVDGLRIYERTRITELSPGRASAEQGVIRAKQIVIATHFPFLNRHGSYFLKLYQERSYVLALLHAQQLDGMYIDASSGGLNFRNAGALLLVSGRGGRTGTKYAGWTSMLRDVQKLYPSSTEQARWAAQDCMTLDGFPYIGQYSKRTPGLYVATGFGKWGMTWSMAAALLLQDLIQGRENVCAAMVSPSRSMLRPQLAVNGLESSLHLLQPTIPRCPHMGCALRWNSAERTWDCPCHGSRFAEDGTVLNGPANRDKR